MKELLLRALIGGAVVSAFAQLGDLFKPKRFAGLFGAAPSVALATIGLTIASKGREYAAVEARSMIGGALAFLVYAVVVSWLMMRYKLPAMYVTLVTFFFWLGIAMGLWAVWLHGSA